MTDIPFTTEQLKQVQIFAKGIRNFNVQARKDSEEIHSILEEAKRLMVKDVIFDGVPPENYNNMAGNFYIELNQLFGKYKVKKFRYNK